MNSKFYWLKLKEGFFGERYVKALRRLPQGDSLVIVYLKMQLASLRTEGIINYEGLLPDCVAELAMALEEDENVVKLAVEALIKFGVVERWENETLYMVAMQELIGSEGSSAERVRRHRALQKNQKALQSNTGVTECNTEIRDKREEIEKENKREEIEEEKSIDYLAIVNAYKDTCVSLPAVRNLSESRKKSIRARLRSGYTIDDFIALFKKAQESDFLKGKNDRDWMASFDWLIKDSNMAKVLDGNYDNKKGKKNNQVKAKDDYVIPGIIEL